jgi:hypothetical protein
MSRVDVAEGDGDGDGEPGAETSGVTVVDELDGTADADGEAPVAGVTTRAGPITGAGGAAEAATAHQQPPTAAMTTDPVPTTVFQPIS